MPNSATQHALATTSVTIPSTGNYLVLVQGSPDGSTGGFALSAALQNRPCATAQECRSLRENRF